MNYESSRSYHHDNIMIVIVISFNLCPDGLTEQIRHRKQRPSGSDVLWQRAVDQPTTTVISSNRIP